MTTTDPTTAGPLDFWGTVDAALAEVRERRPETFAAVREILIRWEPGDYAAGAGSRPEGAAFFWGSGGDATLGGALSAAGWVTVWAEAGYYYVKRHRVSGEWLTYIEGDVYGGIRSDAAAVALLEVTAETLEECGAGAWDAVTAARSVAMREELAPVVTRVREGAAALADRHTGAAAEHWRATAAAAAAALDRAAAAPTP